MVLHVIRQLCKATHDELVDYHLAVLILGECCPSIEVSSLHLEGSLLADELDVFHQLLKVRVKEDIDAVLEQLDDLACRVVFKPDLVTAISP